MWFNSDVTGAPCGYKCALRTTEGSALVFHPFSGSGSGTSKNSTRFFQKKCYRDDSRPVHGISKLYAFCYSTNVNERLITGFPTQKVQYVRFYTLQCVFLEKNISFSSLSRYQITNGPVPYQVVTVQRVRLKHVRL